MKWMKPVFEIHILRGSRGAGRGGGVNDVDIILGGVVT